RFAERDCGGEARVAVALREAALHDRLAVVAAQERDLLLVEVLACQVGDHREQAAGPRQQVLAEGGEGEVVAGEPAFEFEPAARGAVQVVILGGDVEEAAVGHQNFIFENESYTGPSTDSITQPSSRPRMMVIAGSIMACTLPIDSR